MGILRRYGLFLGVWCGLAGHLTADGFDVVEGELVTDITVESGFLYTVTSVEGDGRQLEKILSDISRYDIDRAAIADLVPEDEFGTAGMFEVATARVTLEHSPTFIRVDGVMSAWWEEVFAYSSLSGTVNFTLDQVQQTEIVRWYGDVADAQLAKPDGQVVFTCESHFQGVAPRCYSPENTDLSKQEFLLPAGEYLLTFSSFSTYEVGNAHPGDLHFEMILVPEPSTCMGALTGMLLCCWAGRHSRRSRRVHIKT